MSDRLLQGIVAASVFVAAWVIVGWVEGASQFDALHGLRRWWRRRARLRRARQQVERAIERLIRETRQRTTV